VDDKGGSERTVGIAKADLVPTDYNLLEDYRDFGELVAAAGAVADSFNQRVHAVTARIPAEALEVERGLLHRVPDAPYSVAFGESRSVGWSSTVSFRGARYSVPDTFVDTLVWVRVHDGEVVIVAGEGSAATEVARHRLLAAGGASIVDAHYRDRPADPLHRQPKAKRPSEAAFLALGEGAKLYLIEAAACGARKIETRMAEAVTLASLHGASTLDAALGTAAMAGRFGAGDLESILVHRAGGAVGALVPPPEHSLAQGTQMWSALGAPTADSNDQENDQ
jgi:hypothetical protein